MNIIKPRRCMVALATVGLLLLLPAGSSAQYRVGEDGRALDANSRIGSGGLNEDRSGSPYSLGNQIVTGNVTGFRAFRWGPGGAVIRGGLPLLPSVRQPYGDPREFRGTVGAEGMDLFIRDSAGVPGAYQPYDYAWEPRAYYGSNVAGSLPAGFSKMGTTGTYVFTPPAPTGLARPAGPAYAPITSPWQGELWIPVIDPATQQMSVLVASPLLGMRLWRSGELSAWASLASGEPGQRPVDQSVPAWSIGQIQEEMRKAAGMKSPVGLLERAGPETDAGPAGAQPVPRPFDAPENPELSGKPIDASLGSTALSGRGGRIEAINDRLYLPAPGQQSSQYAELERRLNRYYMSRLRTDEERHRELLKQLEAREAAEKARSRPVPDEPGPAEGAVAPPVPDYARISQELLRGYDAPGRGPQEFPRSAVEKPAPAKVESLAEGISASSLAKILKDAETLTGQGKYVMALELYSRAEQAAPNNPLVWLGAAHAELGAGYYRRASAHLREVLAGNPALLVAQYDLKRMLGAERLEQLVKDLKETARQEAADPSPVFLLAYLAYNTGNAESAAMYLEEADRRAQGKDRFYRLIREHWALPGDRGAAGQPGVLPLSEVLRQFEEGNVLRATLTDRQLSGELRRAVAVGGKQPVTSFRCDLPAGAASGPLGKWVQEHRRGADLTIELSEPATQPSR